MSLVRCPGCRLDTSDSLAHCPNCGAVLHGSGPRLFDQPSSPSHVAMSSPPPAQGAGLSTQTKAIAFVIAIILLAVMPFLVPLAVIAAVFWFFSKSRKPGQQSRQMDALKILVSEVSRAKQQGSQISKERPLEMLRRIERQLKTPPRA